MPVDLDRDEQKAILKEALNEYLDKQVKAFGWWTLKGLAVLALGGVLYLALIKMGFQPK